MSMQQVPAHRRVIVGVDTHNYIHVAVAIDDLGALLDSRSFAADSSGYTRLIDWALTFGGKVTFGTEGTRVLRSGTGQRSPADATFALSRWFAPTDVTVACVASPTPSTPRTRPCRPGRTGAAVPKSHDGQVEMIRQVKVARDITVKARTAAKISLKQVIVNAPPELREELQPLTKMTLINKYAGLRPGQVTTITASTKYTLRASARRWQHLNAEILDHEKILAQLTAQAAPGIVRIIRSRPRHRSRDAHRRRGQPRPRQVRSRRLRQALRRRSHPSIVRNDQPVTANPGARPFDADGLFVEDFGFAANLMLAVPPRYRERRLRRRRSTSSHRPAGMNVRAHRAGILGSCSQPVESVASQAEGETPPTTRPWGIASSVADPSNRSSSRASTKPRRPVHTVATADKASVRTSRISPATAPTTPALRTTG